MSKWTTPEKDSYRQIVGLIMKGDPKVKAELDARVAAVLKALREQMPEVGDEALADVTATFAFFSASLLKATMKEALSMIAETYQLYSVATAQLVGTYDPADEEVPDCRADLLGSILGLDPETTKRVWSAMTGAGATEDDGPDRKDTGMYL